MKAEEIDKIRRILFWTFLIVFVLSAICALAAFLKAHGMLGAEYNGDRSLIKYLLGAVVIQVATMIFALWKGVFSADNLESKIYDQKYDSTSFSEMVIQMSYYQLFSGELDAVAKHIVKVRQNFPELVSDELIFLEASIRSLLGHGHFIENNFNDSVFGGEKSVVISYELNLLKFSDREALLDYGKKCKTTKQIDMLTNSLNAISAMSLGKKREAKKYFDKIDHNLVDGKPMLDDTDNYIAYSSLCNGIVAAYLGHAEIMEVYFDIAKKIPSNESMFVKEEYPYVLLVAKLHRAFVNSLLGFNDKLPADYIKSVSGHSRVVARFCQLVAESEEVISTIEKLSAGWGENRRISSGTVKKRMYNLQKNLLANSNPVYTGLSAKLVSH